MPYIQNTDQDREAMLGAIGVDSLDELFQSIPPSVRLKENLSLPPALSEPEAMALLQDLAGSNQNLNDLVCFLGGGIYDHYIPPVVDFIAGRSEFYTSYTPYQAEASQGNLQVIFEYQSLICALTGMDVANASLYDGATALAESVLMAQNISRRDAVILSEGIHPEYRQTLGTYVKHLDVPLHLVSMEEGVTDPAAVSRHLEDAAEPGAVVVQQPNFFGCLEDLTALAEAAHEHGALLVVCVNPLALGILKAPGDCGADIVCGEGQCLGIPPSFGGPGLGILAARKEHVRKMPGRLVGATRHAGGGEAYVLTLQTREQHIRRERATSNICTNHALLALRAAIHLCALGKQGLQQVATLCTQKAHGLARALQEHGFPLSFSSPFFNEFVIECGRPAAEIVDAMLGEGFLAGLALGQFFPDSPNKLLVCVTEQRTQAQMDEYVAQMTRLRNEI